MFYSLYINVGGSNIMGYNIFISFRYSDGKQYKEELEQLFSLDVNVNIRMYNFDDVQCTVIPSVAYGFVTGMNLQLC